MDIVETEHFNSIRGGTDTSINLRRTNLSELANIVCSYPSKTRGGTTTRLGKFAEVLNTPKGIDNMRVQRLLGILAKTNKVTMENIPSKADRSQFSCERYKFFLDAPFEISNRCCTIFKKNLAHEYSRKNDRHPFTAQMATESKLRTQQWLANSCNGFDLKEPISNPMSFWTEQDVLLYTQLNNIKLASVYGNVETDFYVMGQCEGQMDFATMGIFDTGRPFLKTTGCSRTGWINAAVLFGDK